MPKADFKRKLAALLAVSAAVWILITLVGGDSGALAMFRAHDKYDALARRVKELEQENLRLEREIRDLKENPKVIERIAREELNMARPGEEVLLLQEQPPPGEVRAP